MIVVVVRCSSSSGCVGDGGDGGSSKRITNSGIRKHMLSIVAEVVEATQQQCE